jgi:hypothetical protein
MSDDEKKISIDELPDEGSSFGSTPAPKPKVKKKPQDPRITQLKSRSAEEQVKAMTHSWDFDFPERYYGWFVYAVILTVLEFSSIYANYLKELDLLNSNFFGVGGDFIRAYTYIIEGVLRHPTILIILAPIFFKFRGRSEYAFSLRFDGVQTVKKVLPLGSKELVSPVLIKWGEIERVEKILINNKEILRLYSSDGHIADIIWYIEIEKKQAVKVILGGMIPPSHPLREFLEKDLK